MNRCQALSALHRLACGLPADIAGQTRLLERVAGDEEAEALRDALTELGARALLEEVESVVRG